MSDLIAPLLICVFALLLVVAAMWDLTTFTIPNWVSIALAAGFIPAALASGCSPTQIALALAVGLVMLAAGVGMFAVGWLGGGDAKLLAAASLWIGLPGLAPFLFCIALAGGGLALLLLVLRSAWVRPFVMAGPAWVERIASPGAASPYGVAIAIGALGAFPHGLLMRAAHGAP